MNDMQYAQAYERVLQLMGLPDEDMTPEENQELDRLAKQIEAYEQQWEKDNVRF